MDMHTPSVAGGVGGFVVGGFVGGRVVGGCVVGGCVVGGLPLGGMPVSGMHTDRNLLGQLHRFMLRLVFDKV